IKNVRFFIPLDLITDLRCKVAREPEHLRFGGLRATCTMLSVIKSGATQGEIDGVVQVVERLGFRPHVMPGATRTAIGITGNQGSVDPIRFEGLPGVFEAIRVSKPYKLITLDLQPDPTVVRVGDATIDRKSTRLKSSHRTISYAVFCLKKKKIETQPITHGRVFSGPTTVRACGDLVTHLMVSRCR